MGIRNMFITCLALGMAGLAVAQHPHPQPSPGNATQQTQGNLTVVSTAESLFPEPKVSPFDVPPGTNFLPTVYTNNYDSFDIEMPHTLPSTPTVPYNLHVTDPVVTEINPISPTDDLFRVFEVVRLNLPTAAEDPYDAGAIRKALQMALDILVGRPISNRAYSGFPLLHYNGPDKLKKVKPITNDQGEIVSGNVNIHQIWYDNHIESDTALLDPTDVWSVPWTITYTVDVLNRGHDDFSPFVMYFDNPAVNNEGVDPHAKQPSENEATGPPHVGMDQTFFNMEEGTRTVLKLGLPPGKYYNLSYTWGWRMHPPRVQVSDNARKVINGKTLHEWETSVFGNTPTASEQDRLNAIAMIGNLSPAKRMWQAFREALKALEAGQYEQVGEKVAIAREAFDDWRDRTSLPSGVSVDKEADLTLLYVNNTIYGEFTDGGIIDFPTWQLRGAQFKATLLNGDYFDHGYQNVDFGGARGWENQFKSSVKVAGSGCWFTFGRAYWWPNMNMITVPAASQSDPLTPGLHKVHITFNYEASRRLRFYQFDPTHHDVAVYSIH